MIPLKMKLLQQLKSWQHQQRNRVTVAEKYSAGGGFTLLEVLLVVFMLSILAGIGIPSWLAMVNNTRLKRAIVPIEQAINQAQSKAKQQKSTWQVTIQQTTDAAGDIVVQWAVHPASSTPNWQTIDKETGIKIDDTLTTLDGTATLPWSIQFNDKGNLSDGSPLGQVTLTLQSNANKKRCVRVLTLLGATRTAENQDCNPSP
ncbi:type II secretion system protein [Phormidium sp. CCY1219]|uniref:type II secretion system protein n=1 Tax=Phormidium sp. CCY1219 TaxID=2886104 RepID=UPI002D79D67F|nr:type II secretion system protein [Phormidium sp. CCY1219]